jgi:hypothetical protein
MSPRRVAPVVSFIRSAASSASFGTSKEVIDLGWAIRATVDAGDTASANADLGTSGVGSVRAIAPR